VNEPRFEALDTRPGKCFCMGDALLVGRLSSAPDVPAQLTALKALRSALARDAYQAAPIARAGGADCVLQAARAHPGDAGVQMAALAVLQGLCRFHASARHVVSGGGARYLLALLSAPACGGAAAQVDRRDSAPAAASAAAAAAAAAAAYPRAVQTQALHVLATLAPTMSVRSIFGTSSARCATHVAAAGDSAVAVATALAADNADVDADADECGGAAGGATCSGDERRAPRRASRAGASSSAQLCAAALHCAGALMKRANDDDADAAAHLAAACAAVDAALAATRGCHARCPLVLTRAIGLLGALLGLGGKQLAHATAQYMLAVGAPTAVARAARAAACRSAQVAEAASIFTARLQSHTSLSQQLLQFA
jgi:hypothetical protein